MAERLDAFIARANARYYATHDPFRDFTTSPEISQVFGELLGAWSAVVWDAMGRPDPVLLVECGPGRGTLMGDALRAARQAPPFAAALRVHLVETSPRLRAIQEAAIPQAVFHDSLDALPPGPAIVLANEFLDALPVRQLVRRAQGWRERFVSDGAFVERDAAAPDRPDAPEDTVVELHEAAETLTGALARRLVRDGGAALFVDYGPEHSGPGDSLQALRGGKPADPLAAAGDADLTAHVDFAGLARAARGAGATVHGPLAQGLLLARLGLFQRTDRLARTVAAAEASRLVQAAQRLAEPAHMGRLFKALAICHPGLPVPPGFETAGFEEARV